MILASCRENFTNPVFQGPLKFSLDGRQMPGAFVREYFRGKRVAVLVHGYHTGFDDALAAYKSIWAKMQEHRLPYDEPFPFFWSGGALAAGFLKDIRNATNSAGELLAVLNVLAAAGATVDIQTHSLGARVALQAAQYECRFRHLILSAPAVDEDCLEVDKEFDRATLNQSGKIIVAHSKRDGTLGFAYRASKLWLGKKALGYDGPKSQVVDVLPIDMQDCVGGHSEYKNCDAYYERWKAAL